MKKIDRRPLIAAMLVAMALASCHTARTMTSDWSIDVSTQGGIAGRGLGSVSLSSKGADFPNRDAVARAVDAAAPEKWKSSYAVPGNPRGYADQILYKLTLTRGGQTYSTWWYDESRPLLPPDLGALFDVVWNERSK